MVYLVVLTMILVLSITAALVVGVLTQLVAARDLAVATAVSRVMVVAFSAVYTPFGYGDGAGGVWGPAGAERRRRPGAADCGRPGRLRHETPVHQRCSGRRVDRGAAAVVGWRVGGCDDSRLLAGRALAVGVCWCGAGDESAAHACG